MAVLHVSVLSVWFDMAICFMNICERCMLMCTTALSTFCSIRTIMSCRFPAVFSQSIFQRACYISNASGKLTHSLKTSLETHKVFRFLSSFSFLVNYIYNHIQCTNSLKKWFHQMLQIYNLLEVPIMRSFYELSQTLKNYAII